MRYLAGALGGALLTLILLTLLALLVTPPVDERPEIERPMSVSMVEAPQEQAPSDAPLSSQAAPRPPAATPPPPPPAAVPAPSPTSPMAMPTPHVPSPESPSVPLDRQLPELTTQQPDPQPQPKAQPKPEPQPQPKPAPRPTPSPEPPSRVAEASASDSRSDSATDEASQAPASNPGVVSSPQPTRKVPPAYPSRAQRRGIEGYVEVRFTIRPNGSVDRDSLRVVDAEPRHVFDRAALRAIADWQFPRAPQPREARQRLVFRLKG